LPTHQEFDPCVDFASFACGPAGRRGGEFWRAEDLLNRRGPILTRFLDELASGRHLDGTQANALVRDFYGRCRDHAARAAGMPELADKLDAIAKIRTLPDLARTLGELRRGGSNFVVSFHPAAEGPDPDGLVLGWVALRLPVLPPALYTGNQALVFQHSAHWRRLAALSGRLAPGEVNAAAAVDEWLAKLAAMRPKSPPGPPGSRLARASLERRRFPWSAYFEGLGLPPSAPLGPVSDRAFDEADELARMPLEDLKSYVRMLLVEVASEFVTEPLLEEEERYHDGIEKGRPHEPFPLSAACVNITFKYLKPQLADAYLTFLADARSEDIARRMFAALRYRLESEIRGEPWMDQPTREAAVAKLEGIKLQFIGDLEAREVPGLALGSGSLLAAFERLREARSASRFQRIGSPEEVVLEPSFDDGSYSVLRNAIWLSPEIVRPPFLHAAAFNAMSFGALGTVLGHEIAHALSPGSRKFDGQGRRRETWSNEALGAYLARVACLERQNGAATNNEDVADLAGTVLALDAMEADAKRLDYQRAASAWGVEFFVAYAQMRCTFHSDQRSELEALKDPHSSTRTRINGVVKNIPKFGETFQCAPGAPMAPRERCAIW
jgi:predicted metalloendopeptidase